MKKGWSFLLSLVLLLTLFVFPANGAEATERAGFSYDRVQKVDTSGYPDIMDYDAENRVTAYRITSAEGLMKVAQLSNTDSDGNGISDGDRFHGVTLYLTRDLDMSGKDWTPIGFNAGNMNFGGTIDGQGHAVYNLVCSRHNTNGSTFAVGLIGFGRGCTVRNLIIGAGSSFTYTHTHNGGRVGAFIGSVSNGQTAANFEVLVDNCYNLATVNGGIAQDVGGFIGFAEGGTDKPLLSVQYCTNAGEIKSSGVQATGGMVGRAICVTSLKYCRNTAPITDTNRNTTGGIVGRLQPTTVVSTVEGCVNDGDITGYNARTGGIIGNIEHVNVLIQNNANYGTVVIAEGGSGVAGQIKGLQNGGVTGSLDQILIGNRECMGQEDPDLDEALLRALLCGVQMSGAADGKYAIRLVGSIDSLNYQRVGFAVSAVYGENGTKQWNDIACKTVFQTLLANHDGKMEADTAKALRGEGSWLYALNVEDIPVDAGSVTFTVHPWCERGGRQIAGPVYTVVCSGTGIISVTLN